VPPRKPIDASIIDRAPDEPPEAARALPANQVRRLSDLIANLQTELGATRAENEQLKAKIDLETEKAKLVKPYANKVFGFLCAYCAGVFVLLLFNGFHSWGFSMSNTVMGVLVGSTAAAAIGLVHTVVKGLFGPVGRISGRNPR
jgi:hypothetical protein